MISCSILVACGPVTIKDAPEIVDREDRVHQRTTGGTSFLGTEGILSLGPTQRNSGGGVNNGIGVNAFLWRASLDAISFMPLTQVDAFGGVIITDWYSDPKMPDERFKMTVLILSQSLSADGIKVSMFKQAKKDKEWYDVEVNKKAVVLIEDNILTRARNYNIASKAQQ